MSLRLHQLRRLPPIFQDFTPSSLMLRNFGCSACTCMKKQQTETTYLILGFVLLASPLPLQQNNDGMKSANWEFSQNLIIIC